MIFYKVAVGFVKVLSHLFFPYEVHGDVEKMPKDGGLLLCANHISYFDVVFLAAVSKREIRFVGKDKYANAPVLKHIFKWVGAFGIDPDTPDVGAIKQCFRVIKNGEVLGIFPEGTRILNGKVSNPMPGAIMIAHKTKAPIFYMRIKPSKGVFKTFRKTHIYIGECVTTADLNVTNGKGDEYKKASIELMDRVYNLGE